MIDVRPFVETLQGKDVAVYGLGVSNRAAVKALSAAGATVVAWDDDADKRAHESLQQDGVEISNLLDADMSRFGALILAPGIPLVHPEPHPIVIKALEHNIELMCDLEVLHRSAHGLSVIGITGTNGKSTTTALIGHILNENGVNAAIGGNIGHAALDLDIDDCRFIVLEVSSFQLDLCPSFSADIGVLLNITPDHLDRHDTMEAYADAKARLFRGAGDAVIGRNEKITGKVHDAVKKTGERDVYPIDVDVIADMEFPALSGAHNQQNIAAVLQACLLAGLEQDDILAAIETFPGLMHRQFLTRTINGVAYVNDSKATNADATSKALACYDNIHWIVGGVAKDGGLAGLEDFADKIVHAYVIGTDSDIFTDWLAEENIPYTVVGMLDVAVHEAHESAQEMRGQPGGAATILLSPAAASFDQFSNFEHRGDAFTQAVEALPEDAADG